MISPMNALPELCQTVSFHEDGRGVGFAYVRRSNPGLRHVCGSPDRLSIPMDAGP